jgi:hypothetical protein
MISGRGWDRTGDPLLAKQIQEHYVVGKRLVPTVFTECE